jgi:HEAT repeat protein
LSAEAPAIEEPSVEASAVEEATVETPAVETPTEEFSTAETLVDVPTAETLVEAPTVETSAAEAAAVTEVAEPSQVEVAEPSEVAEVTEVSEPVVEETTAIEPLVEESAVEEVVIESAPVVLGAATALDAVSSVADSPTTEIAPASETPVTDITLAGVPEPDVVQAETKRLLEGETFNSAVIGTSDSMSRQMIAAELLSAIASRNSGRRERARAAFLEHGYFDEKVGDLSKAEAPAERAAAARSLAIVRDRAATPHLVAALEDKSIDVRRAAVEALGELRDPVAIGALESLLERERMERIRIPPRIVRNAIESCREGREEALAAQQAEVEPAPAATSLVEEVSAPVVETAPAAVEETHAVADEPEAVAESPAFAEPSAAGETGLQPFAETLIGETAAADVAESETTVVETIEPPVAEFEETTHVSEVSEESAASKQVALFDESSAFAQEPEAAEAEATSTGVEPFVFEVEETPESVSAVEEAFAPSIEEERGVEPVAEHVAETTIEPVGERVEEAVETSRDIEVAPVAAFVPPVSETEKGVTPFDEHSTVPASVQQRLASHEPSERAAAIGELSHADSDEAFQQICNAFDDEAKDVRSAAARALYELRTDRAESFTRALREATPERRRQIGSSIASSGLASEAISQLTGESREKTYEAFSLLFLMAKAGEVNPLIRAIEGHPNNEVRLAVVKLLALSGQKEILPAFRRLAVRGSLPTEVRSAVMEAIYQISSSQPSTSSVA